MVISSSDTKKLLPSLRPHYSARPKRFGSRVRFGDVTESELTERDWENAVQGLGKKTQTQRKGYYEMLLLFEGSRPYNSKKLIFF